MLKRVLIANRGEIAIRIARAADALGIETVAVFTPADSQSSHTRYATHAAELGPSAGSPSQDPVGPYLDRERLVRTALETGCDSVHPGYGFLSEHAAFADLCAAEGLVFVGPPPSVLSLFGDKVRARAFAHSVGVPIVPGSESPLASPEHAATIAQALGFPVMLKAAAGGGGRGMRLVERAEDIPSAFERCRGEAISAFGDGTLFMEKVVVRPRHIEVQVLGDAAGNVVHLFDRDCSVQERNQKVVEIAPAPKLDRALRNRILDDAVKLAKAASYVNAGTVEFLVSPETGEYFFIECNPRIQVEHTVTEMVTGVDLVEAQLRIASGETLTGLGIGDQQRIQPPLGFAVQARVVARGAGVMAAYKEPSGPRIRVDACGYQGYTPPAQFDPLFAKVIGGSNSSGSFESAVERTLRALGEFHISGLPSNIGQLRAILGHPTFIAGDARTTLMGEHPEIRAQRSVDSGGPLALFERQKPTGTGRSVSVAAALVPVPVGSGQRGVEAPMGGALLELRVKEGDDVSVGDTLVVISAMKMETNVTAPCGGTVATVAGFGPGEQVAAGQILVVLTPAAGETALVVPEDETWAPVLGQVRTLQSLANARLAPGSQEPGVVRQRSRGKLNCRERIHLLLDDGSFHEVGSVAGFASYDDEGAISAFTPANHVGGWGKVRGRTVIVCADDFTSRGGHSDGAIGAKSSYLDRLSIELRVPAIRLLDGSSGGGSVASMVPAQRQEGDSAAKESSGAITAGRPRVTGGGGSFLPGHLGSSMYAEQLSTVPVVNVLLGSVVGIGAAKAVLGHFSVMVRDIAQLFVAGPPVVSHAMGYDVSKEDLGDWRIHCTNGSVDNLAETEDEAFEMTRRFLSYLPPSVYETPPVLA
ncbi:MAG: biotin carboxylase N-terminal domain-containing protein, partial [Dehalococcoidia bacterium]